MRLIIVSNRLPVTVVNQGGIFSFRRSVGGVTSGLSSYLKSKIERKEIEYIWVGWPGIFVKDELKENLTETLLKDYNCYPIYLSEVEIEGFYSGFCNKVIWPLFHDFPEKAVIDPNLWDYYVNVNQLFSNVVKTISSEDDIIWVHDYHLMLLPTLLRQDLFNIQIGFFLHIPFPSIVMFSLLNIKWQMDLLKGILGADIVGFHTSDYTKNFEGCLRTVLNIESKSNNTLCFEERVLKIDCFPMGIDFKNFSERAKGKNNIKKTRALKNTFNGNKLILSVDRLDYTKGILNRLSAFELFLERYPAWYYKVNMLLVVAPSRIEVESYSVLKSEIDSFVININAKFGSKEWTPIIYQYKQFSSTDLITLYTACDVAILTPLKDGMNLIAKEYIACRNDYTGTLILSERAGASKELSEAIIVDPDQSEELINALFEALTSISLEQIKKIKNMQYRLQRNDVFSWANEFLLGLKEANSMANSLFKNG